MFSAPFYNVGMGGGDVLVAWCRETLKLRGDLWSWAVSHVRTIVDWIRLGMP